MVGPFFVIRRLTFPLSGLEVLVNELAYQLSRWLLTAAQGRIGYDAYSALSGGSEEAAILNLKLERAVFHLASNDLLADAWDSPRTPQMVRAALTQADPLHLPGLDIWAERLQHDRAKSETAQVRMRSRPSIGSAPSTRC